MTRFGGFGGERLGAGPFGAGGPLHVVRAMAVASQVVRVVFNEEPLHRGAGGRFDSLNPANYGFAITAGQGTTPLAMVVDSGVITGPTRGVNAGEYAVDVHVDRPLVVGLSFSVTVRNVQGSDGDLLGAPVAAAFVGVAPLRTSRTPSRMVALVDFATDIATGALRVDDSGDIATHSGVPSLRERLYRRQTVAKDAFTFLPGYGSGQQINRPATTAAIMQFRGDYLQQVKQEPDVADASVTVVDQTAINVLTVKTRAIPKTGGEVPITATYASDGTVAVT